MKRKQAMNVSLAVSFEGVVYLLEVDSFRRGQEGKGLDN